MFKKVNKTELKTWMMGDIILFVILTIAAATMLGTGFSDQTDSPVGYIIFGIIFFLIALLTIFIFIKMIQAFKNYDQRMALLEAEEEAKRLEEERLEKERLKNEEIENKRFAEEYKKRDEEAKALLKTQKEEETNHKK